MVIRKLFFILLFVLFGTWALAPKIISAQTSTLCRADINQDGIVDLSDYSQIAINFFKTNPSNPRADINQDGIVDLTDYSQIAINFFKPATGCVSTPSPAPSQSPTSAPTASPSVSTNEWSQHAFNAQNTSFAPQEVAAPWRWKWSWNGPNSSGGISSGKTSLPRNVQPVTGGGRVYVASGAGGVFALNNTNGSVVWNRTGVGTINSTVAFDPGTNAIFAISTSGVVYKLDATSGNILNQYNLGASSTLPLPPAIAGSRVFVSMGNKVSALSTSNLAKVWEYTTNSTVQTPPAYSATTDRVVVGTQDLYVLAINNSNGGLSWRVKPTVRNAASGIEYSYGWPVIADSEGLVLVKIRLDWDTLWNWNPWPTTNAAIRANLQSQPNQQALFAMRLTDGSSPFIMNVGHGGYGDGGYMPMGPQPVVKTLNDGNQVAYMIGRADNQYDGRWDSKFVEIPLDNTTVSGYSGGEVRFITYNHIILTDEQPNLSMAGDHLLGGHWMAGKTIEITDRSASRGSYSNRIQSTELPHITTSASNCGFSASHYCAGGLVQDGDPRTYPAGHYIYYNQGTVYDAYWSSYASYVVSNNTVYFRSNDGAIVAFESGSPTSSLLKEQPLSWLGNLKNKVLGAFSGITQTLSLANADTLISYSQAKDFSGENKTVEGQIKYIFNNGKTILLGFEYPHQGVFKVQIPKKLWSELGEGFGSEIGRNQETAFQEGDWIQVTGKIDWYQGDPAIYLDNASNITVINK